MHRGLDGILVNDREVDDYLAAVEAEEGIPDIFDIEEWIGEHHPAVLPAVHYLQPKYQYFCYVKIWKDAQERENNSAG